MIKAHIKADGFPPDLIGVHEFIQIPPIGTSISVMDRNANMHYLTVTDVRFRGLTIESETAGFQRELMGGVSVIICGTRNSDWSREMQN